MPFVRLISLTSMLVGAGCSSAPQEPGDCHPTFGDNCDCAPKCMTDAEESALGDLCDMDCSNGNGGYEPDWTCTVEDGACAVVP